MFDELQVLHICAVPVLHGGQNIYRHQSIKFCSQLVHTALQEDFEDWRRLYGTVDAPAITAGILVDRYYTLRTVAVLARLFELDIPGSTVEQLSRAIASRVAQQRHPLLIFDEAFIYDALHGGHEDSRPLLVFLRTVVRAAGLATLFMGTTADMVQFVEARHERALVSMTDNRDEPWAEFLTRLPPFAEPAPLLVTEESEASAFYRRVVAAYPRTNPRNLHMFRRALESGATSVAECLAQVAAQLYDGKVQLRSEIGVVAQVQYFLNAVSASRTGPLVGNHIAAFPDSMHSTVLVLRKGRPVPAVSGAVWDPRPDFPTTATDPLLALLLGGPCVRELDEAATEHPPPFAIRMPHMEDAEEPIPLTAAAALVVSLDYSEQAARRKSKIDLSNRSAVKRDGNVVECMTALAAIQASRAGSDSKTVLAELFLRHFVTELQAVAPSSGQPLHWSSSAGVGWDALCAHWTKAATWTLPKVARVEWLPAGAVGAPDLGLQPFLRTPDSERVDGRVDHLEHSRAMSVLAEVSAAAAPAPAGSAESAGRGSSSSSGREPATTTWEGKNYGVGTPVTLELLLECLERWLGIGKQAEGKPAASEPPAASATSPASATPAASVPPAASATPAASEPPAASATSAASDPPAASATPAAAPDLGFMVVSKIPKFKGTQVPKNLDRFRAVLSVANVVSLTVAKDGDSQAIRVTPVTLIAVDPPPAAPRDKLFCLVKCDEAEIRSGLWVNRPEVAELFQVPKPEQTQSGVCNVAEAQIATV